MHLGADCVLGFAGRPGGRQVVGEPCTHRSSPKRDAQVRRARSSGVLWKSHLTGHPFVSGRKAANYCFCRSAAFRFLLSFSIMIVWVTSLISQKGKARPFLRKVWKCAGARPPCSLRGLPGRRLEIREAEWLGGRRRLLLPAVATLRAPLPARAVPWLRPAWYRFLRAGGFVAVETARRPTAARCPFLSCRLRPPLPGTPRRRGDQRGSRPGSSHIPSPGRSPPSRWPTRRALALSSCPPADQLQQDPPSVLRPLFSF